MKRFSVLFLLNVVISWNAFASLDSAAMARAKREWPVRTLYEISVQIDPAAQKYSGHETVTFHNRQKRSTNYVLFFVYPNDPGLTKSDNRYLVVSKIMVNGIAAKSEETGPSLRVLLGQELLPGKSATVEFDFEATIPAQKQNPDLFSEAMDELKRLLDPSKQSETDYGVFSSGKEILNLGLWYPILSKYDSDGWDEEKYSGLGDVTYFDPADFKVRISVPAAFRVVTTGSETGRVPSRDGTTTHQFESLMTRDFEVELGKNYSESTRLENGTVLRAFYLPQHSRSGAITLDSAVKAFQFFDKEFGPYPYTELDIVEAPLFGGAGGVEFPGLVTISSLLFKEDNPKQGDSLLQDLLAENPAFDQLLEFVVAHEVAHQWWNAVVGSNSKKFPFIDESMANYSAVLYFEHYYGREAAERQMAMQLKVNYQLHRMMGGQDKPVILPASSYEGALEYSAIVYGKGALFFDHLRALMGEAPFLSAVKTYYDAYWFDIAGPEDFKKVAQRKAPSKSPEIEALFQRWMNEMHGDEDIGAGSLEDLMRTVLSTNENLPADQFKDLLNELDNILKEKD